MTPAGRLTAAADLLEDRAAKATPGPWEVREYGGGWGSEWIVESAGAHVVDTMDGGDLNKRHGNAAWIALLGPDKAPLLAAWLRDEATLSPDSRSFFVLAFADSILGQAGAA